MTDIKISELRDIFKKYFIIIICFLALNFVGILYLVSQTDSCANHHDDNISSYKSYKAYRKKATSLWLDKDYDSLLKLHEEKLKENPEDATALYGKAEVLYRLGNLEESMEMFNKTKEVMPAWASGIDPYLEKIKQKMKKINNI